MLSFGYFVIGELAICDCWEIISSLIREAIDYWTVNIWGILWEFTLSNTESCTLRHKNSTCWLGCSIF